MTTRSWLTVHKLATEYRFHPSTIMRWIEAGDVPAYRIGYRHWRIPRDGWLEYLERQRAVPRDGSSAGAA